MKQKKKWMIPLCVIGGLLLVCAGLLWYMVSHSLDFSVGRCLVAENGSYMFIDGNSPIVMSNRKDKEGMFAGLETGDKILLLHDGIQESYPGGTGAYWYMKLEDGTQADIPEQVMEELAELGWTIVANEADPNVVAPAPEAYAFDAQYIRTDGYSDDRSYPYHAVISSKAELEAYYEAYKDIYDLERREVVYSDTSIGFLDACDKYDDAYFERQNLVLIVLQEGSGSIRHEITDVRRHRLEDGASDGWAITIDSKAPEVVTDDMAQWHLFLEVQMGDVIKPTDKVWVNGVLSERAPAVSGLVGISRTPATYAYQDHWGVKLTAKNITPSGLTIVCTQQDGEPTGELNTGSYYGLEVLRDGEWVAVELLPMEGELAWTSEAWMIPANEDTEWDVNWSRLYGELPAGSYRIRPAASITAPHRARIPTAAKKARQRLRLRSSRSASCRLSASSSAARSRPCSGSSSPRRSFTVVSSAPAMRTSIPASGTDNPVSQRDTAWRVTYTFAASSSCDNPLAVRSCKITCLVSMALPPLSFIGRIA